MLPKLLLILASTAVLTGPRIYAVDTHGYLRTGIGATEGGSDQACFKAPKAEAKARLGNECETYAELTFAEDFKAADKSPSKFRGQVTLALVAPGHRGWESTEAKFSKDNESNSQDLTVSLVEAYVQASNVLFPDAKVWIGKRFYQRHDIHMLDYYYLSHSGPGAGIEDIAVGPAKLHLALSRQTPAEDNDKPAQTNFDVRLSNVSFIGGSTLEPVIIYGQQVKAGHKTGAKNYEPMSGVQFALIHGMPTPIGHNNFILQYGKGVFGANLDGRGSALGDFGGSGNQSVKENDNTRKDAQEKSTTTRVIEHLAFTPTPAISGEFVILYQDVDFGGYDAVVGTSTETASSPNLTELTIGARPILHLDETYSVAFEVAHSNINNAVVQNNDYKTATLTKYTLAPQISPSSNYWVRPQLRFFATYAQWNKDSKGQVGTPALANATQGWASGLQVETWW